MGYLTYKNSDTLKKETIPYWEAVALNTSWGRYVNDIERNIIIRASRLSKEKETVLEIGCEGGRWLEILYRDGFKELIGTDVNQASLEICQKRLPDAKCILVKPEDTYIPCEHERLDLLLVMEVVPVIHAAWFYREASRTLKPGGMIVGVITNKHSLRALLYKLLKKGDETYLKQYDKIYEKSYTFWKKLFAKHHLEIIYEVGFCWFPFPRRSNSLFIPVFTTLEKILGLRKSVHFAPWIGFIGRKKRC